MGPLFWINVFTRWLHVTCAVVGIGAIIFWRLALQPALDSQEPGTRQAVLGKLEPRFKMLVHAALGLLILTGAYNFYAALPRIGTLAYHSLYQSIIGTKILLALALFGIVSAVLSSSPASGNMQERRRGWLTLIVGMALVILLLSAILRRLWDLH